MSNEKQTETAPGWQPIATAPRDGRDVFLHDVDEPVTVVGYWKDGVWRMRWDDEPLEPAFGMTHWMSIPEVS